MSLVKIAESARVIGKVKMGDGSYIAQGSIIRSIGESIKIDNNSMVLENSILIGTPSYPLDVGQKTVFGHKCLVVGATIGDLCEIGNCVIIQEGAQIGNMCIFGEGTLIPKNMIIPDGSVVVGRPGRIIRKLSDADRDMIKKMRGNDISLSTYKENIIEGGNVNMGKLYNYKDKHPKISDSAYLYDSAEITGDVIVGDNSIIGSGVKIIGDSHGPVRIGNNVHILENTVLHLLPDNELVIKDNVTIGPGCMIHGTTIGENSVIESGAIVCDYSSLGENTLVKSGSLVKQRSVFSGNQVLEGYPATEVRVLDEKLERPVWAFE
ncbi:MAG: DapH/DapD/GlmU-related protein [Gudongella sp.]|jgi:carbonic anhydrase/acetyltransferase-like protein (isoleucine patch superfamily)|nr:DapH/DapD/GlmU-related protein [Gudongella sp.]